VRTNGGVDEEMETWRYSTCYWDGYQVCALRLIKSTVGRMYWHVVMIYPVQGLAEIDQTGGCVLPFPKEKTDSLVVRPVSHIQKIVAQQGHVQFITLRAPGTPHIPIQSPEQEEEDP
jgi:hypothetical protein